MSSGEKTTDLTERYRLAQEIVKKAGELAMQHYRRREVRRLYQGRAGHGDGGG